MRPELETGGGAPRDQFGEDDICKDAVRFLVDHAEQAGIGVDSLRVSGPTPVISDEDEAAAASGADDLGVGNEMALRADSLLSITQMMSFMAFVAMEGSLRTSRRISTSYMPASRMSRTTESV